ncbi:MAG TPA: flavodoxin [Thermoplasmatales archaeon]|nr:flavodoxin [Thermoplasmatales archaeon]
MKTLIIYVSFHHRNTERIANEIAEVMNAEMVKPEEVKIENILSYDLIGFGSGIYFMKHHPSLLKIIDKLPVVDKMAFIFSTKGAFPIWLCHMTIKRKLKQKGFKIIGEFSCRGFDTYGPLKYIKGINKGKPDENDLNNAREFARNLI